MKGKITQEAKEVLEAWKPKEYHRGAVVRVKLHNFMSYDACEFFPGPRLNMVIGANGSGKSTIVSALALGLGGGIKDLNRAKSLEGFIKHGKDEAEIEIELYEPKKNVIVRRKLCRGVGKAGNSIFNVDGKDMPLSQVQKVLKDEYSIQVGNLCQFLPQDKVSHFSRLSPKELLRETIRAGLSQKAIDEQKALADLHDSESHIRKELSVDQNRLSEKEREMELLESQAELLRDRQKIEANVKVIQDKILALQFWAERKKAVAWKKSHSALEKKLEAKKQEITIIKQRLEENNGSVNVSEGLERSRTALLRSTQKFNEVNFKKAEAVAKVDKIAQNISVWRNSQEQLAVTIEELERKRDEHQTGFELLKKDQGNIEALKLKNQELEAKKKDVLQNEHRLVALRKAKEESIRADRFTCERINADVKKLEMQDLRNPDRLLKLPQNHRERIVRQYQQVQQFQRSGELSENVFLVALEISAKTPLLCAYAERAVTMSHMGTFVTTNKKDRDFLMNKKGFTVMNVDTMRPVRRGISEEFLSNNSLCCLDELIDCRPEILQALRDLASIQKVVVGMDKNAQARLEALSDEEIANNLAGYRVFTPSTTFSFTRARYGNRALLTRVYSTNPDKKAVMVQKDVGPQIEEKKKEFNLVNDRVAQSEEELRNLHAEIDSVKEEQSKVLEKSQGLLVKINAHDRYRAILKDTEERLAGLLEEKQQDQTGVLKGQIDKYESSMERYVCWIEKTVTFATETNEKAALEISSMAALTQSSLRMKILEASCSSLERELPGLESTLVEHLTTYKKYKQRVIKMKDELDSREPDKKKIAALKIDSIEELEASLVLLRHKLQGSSVDTSALTKLESLKEEVATLREEVLEKETKVQEQGDEYTSRRNMWEELVGDLMNEINANFTQSFEKVRANGYQCHGEVDLQKFEGNIMEYGVSIKVSFRENEELQPLSNFTQSGGERSLTTFMYLLSLNEVSKVPFRVVDEINQGMDEDKERISFLQLLDRSCGEFKDIRAQYFLITPKLLTGLPLHHPDITFHIVFNGLGALPQKKFSFKRMLTAQPEPRKRIRVN